MSPPSERLCVTLVISQLVASISALKPESSMGVSGIKSGSPKARFRLNVATPRLSLSKADFAALMAVLSLA
nr:MAG TPA: hypothetical protein [Caudoviricetes sp.]